MKTMNRLIGLTVALIVVLPAAPGEAAFPGANGKIAFEREPSQLNTIDPDGSDETTIATGHLPAWSPDGKKVAYWKVIDGFVDLVVSNADGSGESRLHASTSGFTLELSPAWSPDGTKIAYTDYEYFPDDSYLSQLRVINADGTGDHLVGGASDVNWSPSWSPDGEWIVFAKDEQDPDVPSCCGRFLYRIRPDGTGLTKLNVAGEGDSPDWSPDGSKIVFVSSNGIATVDPDGNGLTVLDPPQTGYYQSGPVFSPDGKRIAFFTQPIWPNTQPGKVYVMNADGSGETALTDGTQTSWPDWQPVPQSYVRPKGATPLRASLVPAYPQCMSPNRMHGAPLSFPSCKPSDNGPPRMISRNVTMGSPDANGAGANFVGTVTLAVHVGNLSTPADEADVAIRAAMRDVRCGPDAQASACVNANAIAGNDYNGELEGLLPLRITDRDNMPSPGGSGPGTVEDTSLSFTLPCIATPGVHQIGSDCNVATSADSLVPGAVKEGKRAVWQLGQVLVKDGGPDGVVSTPTGNSTFVVQGVYAP